MVTISITKASIYSIAEGISVTISLHNGGTPAFEQLWASPSEARKLDIYYREAISDLERRLMIWASEVSAQFDLTASGDDYGLSLTMSRWWPDRLGGLLANKVQDYLVHAVTAGWLNDFDGLSVKTDYAAVAVQDLADILEILHQRSFGFEESGRADDSDDKPGDEYDSATSRATDSDDKPGDEYDSATSRATDSDDKPEDEYDSATSRATDSDDKPEDEYDSATSRATDSDDKPEDEYDSATSRATDSDDKPEDEYDSATSRGSDAKKDSFVLPFEAGFRKKDSVRKDGEDKPFLCRERTDRHRDNDTVCIRTEWTDMSGTGIAYGGMAPRPTRPMTGRGYTPAPDRHIPPEPAPCPPLPPGPQPCGCRPGCPPPPKYDPRKDPKVYPDPPYHAVPPHYPPVPPLPEVHPDGITWSDDGVYDMKSEEKFIDSHICGQSDCHDPFGWADEEDEGNNDNNNS